MGDLDMVYGPDVESDDELDENAKWTTKAQIWAWQKKRDYLPIRDRRQMLRKHLEAKHLGRSERRRSTQRLHRMAAPRRCLTNPASRRGRHRWPDRSAPATMPLSTATPERLPDIETLRRLSQSSFWRTANSKLNSLVAHR